MASVNSLKVDPARGRSTRDVSFDHVGTIDFNVVKPFGLFELVPGDHINLSPEVWLRTQAMNVPTFGKMDVITRAFFVPLRLTWKHFNDFYRQAPVNAGQAHILDYFSEVPHCKMHDISYKFLDRFKQSAREQDFNNYVGKIENLDGIAQRLSFGVYIQGEESDPPVFDFTRSVAASTFFYRFNAIGKRVYDLFVSLGYRFQFFSGNLETQYNKGTDANMYEVSVLPILGWLKMFKDWYCPSEFRYLFSDNLLDVRPNVDSYFLDIMFDELCWAVFIFFNDDIFSMCEQAPYRKGNSTNPSGMFITQISDEPYTLLGANNLLTWHTNSIASDKIVGGRLNDFSTSYNSTSGRTQLSVGGQNTFGSLDPSSVSKQAYVESGSDFTQMASAFNNTVSAWSAMAVMRTAQWLQRNNLLSGRVTEYLKAKFGVTPTSARLDIAEYVGHAGSPVKISDIAGTSDDNLASLGAKGTSYNIDKLGYTAEEFGYLYFTVELRPRIGYGQGVDPTVLRIQLTEFYNQEFDSLGFEPVPTECLASGPLKYNHLDFMHHTVNNGQNDNRIFGYLPRMWSYKCKHDNLSGDFMIPSQAYNGDLQSYHLMRTVAGEKLDDFIHNSISFRYAGFSVLDNLFNRIFKIDNSQFGANYDHFMLIVSFDAEINGLPLAMNESWQVNADHNERQGSLTNIQGSL